MDSYSTLNFFLRFFPHLNSWIFFSSMELIENKLIELHKKFFYFYLGCILYILFRESIINYNCCKSLHCCKYYLWSYDIVPANNDDDHDDEIYLFILFFFSIVEKNFVSFLCLLSSKNFNDSKLFSRCPRYDDSSETIEWFFWNDWDVLMKEKKLEELYFLRIIFFYHFTLIEEKILDFNRFHKMISKNLLINFLFWK